MKIAVWHNLPSGGAKRALYEQVKGLQSRGHELEAWCPSSADIDFLPLRDLIKENVVPFNWDDVDSDGRLSNLMYPLRSVQSKLAAMELSCAVCAEQIAAQDFELLFANSCMFFRVPAVGRMLGNLPKVLYLQEPFRKLYEAMPTLPWIARPNSGSHPLRPKSVGRSVRDWIRWRGLSLQAAEERANAGSYDLVLVNSLFSRESVLRAYGLDADVCYPGISSHLFRPDAVPRERFVMGLGSENFEKGVDIAIRAIASIAHDQRPPLVWIANLTSHPYHGEMQSLAASLGVDFTVKKLISDEELVGLLRRAALMLYTSRLEPFGLAPLEANACGTPVVAVAEGGVRETITHMQNGLLVPSRDPFALGRAVLALLEDSELARRLGNNGRAVVEAQWNWDAGVDRLEAHLASAMSAVSANVCRG